VKRLGNDLARLDDLPGARGEAETAILLDWENWWALELDSKPSTAVRLLEGVYSFYKSLYGSNIPVDFVHPESDLSSYELVIAPNLYLVTDDSAQNISRFVSDGGTLLMSFFSGIVDAQDHIRRKMYPSSSCSTTMRRPWRSDYQSLAATSSPARTTTRS
jgi:beta-galactosidase